MKVKNILPQKERLEKLKKNLSLMSDFFGQNKELDVEIVEKANYSGSMRALLLDASFEIGQMIKEIDARIGEAELPEYK